MATTCGDCALDLSALKEFAYIVRDDVWYSVGLKRDSFSCIGCLEKRLGRSLTPADFRDEMINEWCESQSDRLRSRIRGLAQRAYDEGNASEFPVGVYALQVIRCGRCGGDGFIDCDDDTNCDDEADECEIEHDCPTCARVGNVVHTDLIPNEFWEPEDDPPPLITIMRHADRKSGGPRIAYDSIEPALRALATLRELPVENVERLFKVPGRVRPAPAEL